MREIKFRTWDEEHQEWCGADVQMVKIKNGDFVTGMFDHNGFLEPLTAYSDNSRFVIMQYTGLKDKNGVEIYEGDVVSGTMPDSERDKDFNAAVIEWVEDGFAVIERPTEWYIGGLSSPVLNNCIEVIGNIYENPELIK